MKQGITIEDFLQLSYEQSLKMFEIMGYKQTDPSEDFFNKNKTIIAEKFSRVIEKVNIGKMFDIIDKDWFVELNPKGMDSQYNFELKIIERKDCNSEDDYVFDETYNADELCDVLFKVVVEQYLY